jgi:hypothetical protein
MSVKFDNASTTQGNATSYTWSHTVTATNPRRILVVLLAARSSPASDIITGVTYGGVAMTRATADFAVQPGAYIYYLLNPPTGANNVVASAASAFNTVCFAASYYNVNGVGAAIARSSSSSVSLEVTLTNNRWKGISVMVGNVRDTSSTITMDANTVQRSTTGVIGGGAVGISGFMGEFQNKSPNIATLYGATIPAVKIVAAAGLEIWGMDARMVD